MPLFNLQNLIPHGYCLSWGSTLLWMHVVSDVLITLSYFSIPIMLAYFLRKWKDFPFPWLIALFATFIVACGTTHLLAAITIWIPLYWLEGYLKVLTALVSIISVVVLSKIIPQALQLTSSFELEKEIEERKKAEEMADFSYRYTRSLIEASLDPLVTIGLDGKITDVNAATEQVTGVNRNQLIGSDFANYFTNPESARTAYQSVFAQGLVVDYGLAIRHSSGKVTDVLCNASVYRNSHGEIIGVFVAARDITERKQYQRNLEQLLENQRILSQEKQAALDKLEKISNRLPGMVFQFRLLPDGSSYFPYCSEGVKEVFRMSSEEVEADASKLFSRIHPDDNEFVMNSISESAQNLTIDHHPFRVKFENGEERWLMVNAKPEREKDSSTLWHGFVSDITQQKQTENDILKKEIVNKELEKLVQERTLKLQEINDEYLVLNETLTETIEKEVQNNREKDGMLVQQSRLAAMGEMIGNIAHQWRQPLNALNLVLGNIEDAYEYSELTEECLHEQIALANNLIQTMSSTIDDFRDFFKSDGTQEAFDIGNAIRDALGIVGASFKNNEIAVEVITSESISVYGFKGQYRQVLLNILGNAKDALTDRHIQHGKITIILTKEDDFAVVRIQDNAGGIQEDVIEKIFDPYFTTRAQGNGIGLYMSKMIIEKNMHGVLCAKNIEDGAEFVIKVKIDLGFQYDSPFSN